MLHRLLYATAALYALFGLILISRAPIYDEAAALLLIGEGNEYLATGIFLGVIGWGLHAISLLLRRRKEDRERDLKAYVRRRAA